VVWLVSGHEVDAEIFTVDPSQSVLSLSGVLMAPGVALPVESQLPGSLTTHLQGTIEANRDLPGFIAFPGGSHITALPHPGGFLPGDVAADFAGVVEGILPGVDAYGALRDIEFDLVAGPEPIGAGGDFHVFDMVLEFLGGQFDLVADGLFDDSSSVAGFTAGNDTVVHGNLTQFGNNTVLTIPVDTQMFFATSGFGLTLQLRAVGEIVSVVHLPEPATWLLLAIGAVGFVVVSSRYATIDA